MSTHGIRPRGRQKHCAYCDRTFTKVEHLKRHQRSHTGEKPFKCDKCSRSYARSDVLARHLQTHSIDNHNERRRANTYHGDSLDRATDGPDGGRDHESIFIPFNTSLDHQQNYAPPREQHLTKTSGKCPNTTHQRPLTSQASLPVNPTSPRLENLLPTQSRQAQELISSDTIAVQHPDTSSSCDAIGHDDLDGFAHENWDNANPFPAIDFEDTPRPGNNASNSNIYFVLDQGSGKQTATLHSSRQLIMRDQEVVASRDVEERGQEVLHTSVTQLGTGLPSPILPGENYGANRMAAEDFNTYDHGLGQISPPNDLHLSPNMLDGFDFGTPSMPFSLPSSDDQKKDNRPTAFSAEQVGRIRRLWQRQRPNPSARLIRTLWRQVVHHESDNIFSKSKAVSMNPDHPASRPHRTSRWRMNDDSRECLIKYCKELDELGRGEDINDAEPHLTPPHSVSEDGFGRSPSVSADNFPATEILDSSLDFFFQYFHPNIPFIHKSTFDARITPSSLLLPMCLVGLFSLDPRRTKPFVLRYLKKLMRSCRNELTSKALGQYPPWELLLALASTTVVVYLALGLLDEVDDCQAHMLCALMLHIAEKHGLFAVDHGDDLALLLNWGHSDPDLSWKSWARAESTKRMTLCLLWLDMAYTRLMGTAGVVEMDKVELHLPCEDILFEASNSTLFLQAAGRGAQLIMPRMHIRNFHATAPPSLNQISVQTLLRALYLQVAAARTRLLAESSKFFEARPFSPADALTMDNEAKDILASIVMLPTMYANALRSRNVMTSMAWNDLCIAVTADLDLLEVASGRDGLEPASTALIDVARWSRSAGARRALLHAAQIFDVLDSSRIRESNIARPDLLLFVSALVISMYLFVADCEESNLDMPTFELLQDVDWAIVGGEGLVSGQSEPTPDDQRQSDSSHSARDFVRYGGPVTFAGEPQQGGGVSARKVLLRYAHLLDDFGKWDGSKYSQLLRTMSDFVIKDDQYNDEGDW